MQILFKFSFNFTAKNNKVMLESSIKQFQYYKQLAEKAMIQVNDTVLFDRAHDDDNSISMIVQHLSGNMLSRWTNIFTEDGEKSWRNRDQEFEAVLNNRDLVIKVWESGWDALFGTLSSLNEDDLDKIIYIRNEGMSVRDAILRQLCHYSYHVGQIVYKCKQSTNEKWESLSIARNKSVEYNFKKFDQIKEQKHFLDSLLEEGK